MIKPHTVKDYAYISHTNYKLKLIQTYNPVLFEGEENQGEGSYLLVFWQIKTTLTWKYEWSSSAI